MGWWRGRAFPQWAQRGAAASERSWQRSQSAPAALAAGRGTRRVRSVRGEGRGVSDQYGVRDAACPLSTRGRGGGGGGAPRAARRGAPAAARARRDGSERVPPEHRRDVQDGVVPPGSRHGPPRPTRIFVRSPARPACRPTCPRAAAAVAARRRPRGAPIVAPPRARRVAARAPRQRGL